MPAALNYLGYMLAERGERLDESVGYLKKAVAMEPENGSFLDSLGWAYFKAGKLDLAEENLKRAADQLQDQFRHPGTLRRSCSSRSGRFEEAIAAWNRALAGDGDSIDRADIDRKIRDARQKLQEMTRALAAPLACAAVVVAVAAACAAPLMKLPAGAGVPRRDAR